MDHDTTLVLLALVGLAQALLQYLKMARKKKMVGKKNARNRRCQWDECSVLAERRKPGPIDIRRCAHP